MHAFIKEFKDKIVPKYVRHSQCAYWLDNQFCLCKNTFPIGTILSVVDFAKNYILAPQKEIQSQYYNSVQAAIFFHIVYRHVDDSREDNTIFLREYHFYVSDNRFHSSMFVQYCFDIFNKKIKERGIQLRENLLWSDNCMSKFKNVRMFYWICIFHKENNIQHMWRFF